MNRPFVLLTAAIMLGHAIAGCCWHHAHAWDAVGQTCVHDEHGHQHGEQPADPHNDHQPGSCQEGPCVFVRGDSPVDVDQQSLPAIDCCIQPLTICSQTELRLVRAEYTASQDLAPPSRLHLLHQILLI